MVDLDELLADIARRHMRFETLETRHRDSLDFREVSIWGARDALREAYEAGRAAAAQQLPAPPAAPLTTRNPTGGFYAALAPCTEPAAAFAAAVRILAEFALLPVDDVRAFLDSSYGAQFAAEVAPLLDDTPDSTEASIREVAQRWMAWQIGPRTSATYGIPEGHRALVGFVMQAAIEAEAAGQ